MHAHTQTRVRAHTHNCGICEICSGPIKRGYFLTSIKIKKHLEGFSCHSKLPTTFVTWLSNNFQINYNVFCMKTHVYCKTCIKNQPCHYLLPRWSHSLNPGYQNSEAGSTQPVQQLGYRLENTGFNFQGR